MTSRRFLLGSLSLVALLSVAACGSASSSSTSTAASTDATDTTAVSDTPVIGTVPGAPPGGQPGGSSSGSVTYVSSDTGYTLDGGSAAVADGKFTASAQDASGVLVTSGGVLTLTDAVVTTSGASSSSDSSSFYGLDSGVIATERSTITMSGGSVSTTGDGANAIFSTGEGTKVTVDGVVVTATGQYAHGIMATQGGTLTATDVTISTAGANSAAIATDRGSGTITVTGGTAETSGADAPGLYSTGVLTVTGMTISATGSEAAVIEGSNSITLTDTDLTGSVKWGAMIYQSFSGDAEGVDGVFTMTGGSFNAAAGPLFYVTNTNGTITLSDVTLTVPSGVLLNASAGNWGTSGSNGGNAVLIADGQVLTGDVTVDAISLAAIQLRNGSSWTGAINTAGSGGTASVTLDSSSIWNVTADSYVSSVTDPGVSGTNVTNIVGNGHTVYYEASDSANSALGGKTYTLAGGGTLAPA